MNEERLLKVEDAARRMSLSRTHVYNLMASGRLPSVSIGRSRRIRSSDVDKFIAALSDGAAVAAVAG